jgi:hypothetical protein
MFLTIFLLAVAALFYWTWRQNELFSLSVRSGKLLLVRGRIPGTLFSDFERAVRGIERGSIRVQKSANAARLTTTGIDDGTTQRLRNIFGTYPQAALRGAKPPLNPTVGQILGLASLAWFFDRRD